MQEPRWHKIFMGRELPGSREAGEKLAQSELAPLMAAIAQITGDPFGDKESLRVGMKAWLNNELFCKVCIQNLREIGHSPSCQLLAWTRKVLNGSPAPRDNKKPSDGEWFQKTYCRSSTSDL